MSIRTLSLAAICALTPSLAAAVPAMSCKGTLVENPVGDESGDKMKATRVTFTYTPNVDTGAGTFSLERGKMPKFGGEAKETGNPQFPLEFSGTDAAGKSWVGNLFPIAPLVPGDTLLHMLLDMRTPEFQLSGPLSCK